MVAPWLTTDELANPDSFSAAEAIDAASFVLYHLSGRKYGGVHKIREEYCQVGLDQIWSSTYYGPYGRPMLPGPSGYPMMYPELRYGVITNRVGGQCGSCGCTHLLRLRGGPVRNVTSVKVGGKELGPSAYDIYDYSFIASPNECWLSCDDVEVTYEYGTPPPALGKIAAKALADQYLLAMAGDDECALPQRVTSISRQGMSWTLLDPQEFLDKGRTGIYQVDLFLATVNPDGARMRARVFSPDLMRGKARRPSGAPSTLAAPPVVAPSATTFTLPHPDTVGVAAQPMMAAQTASTPASAVGAVTVYVGQPLRWVVPGSFTQESPPRIVVRPSGEEVPPDTLLWRGGNYTLDLASDQVERLLPPGSVLVVMSPAVDGSTTAEANYSVERRTL
jgi:hypothetical protein